MSDLYDKDTYTWAMQQADALRRRSANEVDWDNVAEEIESVGKSEARELLSRYVVLLTHLLKWRFQPERHARSWRNTVKRERSEIERHLRANPGLQSSRELFFGQAYAAARLDASSETDLDLEIFPESNPFTLIEAMDDAFWPETPSK